MRLRNPHNSGPSAFPSPTLCLASWLLALAAIVPAATAPAQEVTLSIREGVAFDREEASELGPGQWTNLDRMHRTQRFRDAMEYIAVNDRTDLLEQRHELLACYYEFLDDHPVVRQAGLRWQKLAAEVVRMISAGYVGSSVADGLTTLLGALDGGGAETTSEGGREFLDGTASALVAKDITANVYGPLLRGEIPIPQDAFLFDAETLRREQLHPRVLAYYRDFTEKDLLYLNNKLTRWYATEDWARADDYDLTSARDRIFLGLRKMGYPESRIESWLDAQGIR